MRLQHLLPIASLATAARLTLTIPSTPLLSSAAALPPSTHATLQSSGPPLRARLSAANTFVFENVTTGSYLGVVHCHPIAFEALRIDVEDSGTGVVGLEKVTAWQTFWGNEWENRGEKKGEGSGRVVIEVRAIGVKEFLMERGGCEFASDILWIVDGMLIRDDSFAAFLLEEPDDPHGALLNGDYLRNAVSDGE
jgi:hypothetical protein